MPRLANLGGWGRYTQSVRVNVAAGTSAEEYLTDLVPGFRQTLEAVHFITAGDGAGAGATRVFRVIKGAAAVAASATIALAATQTKGTVSVLTNGTLADRTFEDTDTLSLDVTAAGTQFTALTGTFLLVWRVQAQQIPVNP